MFTTWLALGVIGVGLVSVGGAFLLKYLERDQLLDFRDSHDRFSKRQVHRITEEIGQRQ